MKKTSARQRIFGVLACIGQLAALFPFAVIGAVVGGETGLLQFAVIFAVWAAFRLIGLGIGLLAEKLKSGRYSIKLHPLINFLARFCCVIPTVALAVVSVLLKLHAAVYFYILPPSLAICFGGYLGAGRSYSDVFTKGWFAVYPIAAILASLMLTAPEISGSAPWAGQALCAGFAAEILIFVVIANQSNIDKCTKQRDAGKAALPHGLRRYNALLVIGIFAVSLGLFVFARPLGKMLINAIVAVVSAVMFVIDRLGSLFVKTDESSPTVGEGESRDPLFPGHYGGSFNDVLMTVTAIIVIVLAIAYRKPIMKALKSLFAAAFRNRDKGFDMPFADEITSSDAKALSPRAQRKAQRELARRYVRETKPALKYRLGYALFLARLRHTAAPPAPSDTTDIHREKGERVWEVDLSGFSEAYDRVRYGDISPTPEELAAQAELLKRLDNI